MQAHDPDLPPPVVPAAAPVVGPHGPSSTPGFTAPGPAGRRFLLGSALVAGLLAAVGSWIAGESILDAHAAALAPRQVAFPTPEMIREQIFLTLPMKRLCREACAGLCPTCGVNRNTRPCSCPPVETGSRLADPGAAFGLPRGRKSSS